EVIQTCKLGAVGVAHIGQMLQRADIQVRKLRHLSPAEPGHFGQRGAYELFRVTGAKLLILAAEARTILVRRTAANDVVLVARCNDLDEFYFLADGAASLGRGLFVQFRDGVETSVDTTVTGIPTIVEVVFVAVVAARI